MFELPRTRWRSVVLLGAPKGFAATILTPPTLRPYVEFVPGSTCEPAGNDWSSVQAGKKKMAPMLIGCRRRNRQNGAHPMITNDPPRRDARGRYARDANGALTFSRGLGFGCSKILCEKLALATEMI